MANISDFWALWFTFSLLFAQSSAWTYSGPEGPDEWHTQFPACGGQNQSPINIVRKSLSLARFSEFQFQNYNNVTIASFLENGHTVVISLPADLTEDQKPSFTGGGFTDRYVFQQMHFHWGPDDSVGSEHYVYGKSYGGEMHLVHYNSKYGNYSNALNHPDGLAVLGVFLQPSFLQNEALYSILKHLNEVTHAGDSVTVAEPVSFHNLLPLNTRKLFRYHGSLTTPPCSEIVTWTVFRYPIHLTHQQLEQFRQLNNDEGNPLINNDRPVQPINNRLIDYGV